MLLEKSSGSDQRGLLLPVSIPFRWATSHHFLINFLNRTFESLQLRLEVVDLFEQDVESLLVLVDLVLYLYARLVCDFLDVGYLHVNVRLLFRIFVYLTGNEVNYLVLGTGFLSVGVCYEVDFGITDLTKLLARVLNFGVDLGVISLVLVSQILHEVPRCFINDVLYERLRFFQR